VTDLAAYYARRAAEYEAVYRRPDRARQAEQSAIAEAIRLTLANRDVLEVACGTGFWTAVAIQVARTIVAIDAVPETLEIARAKRLGPRVSFSVADAYDLAAVSGRFDAGLACFWLSHVPRASLDAFMRGLAARLEPGSPVVLTDNVYVPGVGGDLVWQKGEPDTYKLRTLADGSQHLVLKNYFGRSELRDVLGALGRVEVLVFGQCFWWAACRTHEVINQADRA